MTRRLVAGVLVAVMTATCAGEESVETLGPSGTLRVFAAASLTEAFGGLAKGFEVQHPGVQVALTFGGSSSLARQVNDGAPADVIVTADERTMTTVVDAGNAADPAVIARNRLAIAVEPGNPEAIAALSDLVEPGLIVILCAREVPCGALADAALDRASVEVEPASREENVKAVISKIILGEADAGIVYETDIEVARGDVAGVAIDVADEPALQASYPMAVTTAAGNREAAGAWSEFVGSSEGRRILRSFGFVVP